MEYNISIGNRLRLLNILPAEGTLLTIRIVRELREGLSFSEAELEDAQVRTEELEGRTITRWEEDSIPDKTLDIGPKAAEMIRKALGELDQAGKLRVEHLDLCELFEYEGD